MQYKLSVYKTIDYALQGDTSHTSISGGVATHSFEEIETRHYKVLGDCLLYIFNHYGTPFIFDDRLELQLDDFESLSFYIDEVTTERVDVELFKTLYPELEVLS